MSQLNSILKPYKYQLLFALVMVFGLFICYGMLKLGYQQLQIASNDFAKFQMLKKGQGNFSLTDSLKLLEIASKKSDKLMQTIPKDGRASFLLSRLVDGAQKNNLRLSDIQTMEEISHGHYVEIPLSLSTNGDFIDLEKYFMYLENMDLSIKLRNLKIESVQINKPTVQANVELSAFVFDQ